MWQDAFTEAGLGGLNWRVDSVNHTAVYVQPMVEVGQAFDLSGSDAVAFVRAGVSHQLTNPNVNVTTSLVGGAGVLDTLDLEVATDRTRVAFEAGLYADVDDDLTLQFRVNTTLSSNSTEFGGQVQLRWNF